jgi:hypothetical protein
VFQNSVAFPCLAVLRYSVASWDGTCWDGMSTAGYRTPTVGSRTDHHHGLRERERRLRKRE